MTSKHAALATAVVALLVVACSSGSGATPGTSSQPVAIATLAATAFPEGTASPVDTTAPTATPLGGGSQATPGAIDPCTLLTADEASKLIGKKMSAGVSTSLDPDRVCTFKNGLTEVKLFLAPPAPDLATATSYWDVERAQVPAEVSIKDLNLFDRSAYASGSVAGASLSALFVIDGTQFFEVYCGFPACSQNASVAAAELVAGRLP